jgi:nucleotide-binding universal stress UspA family protein
MVKIKKILFPVDFSEVVDELVPLALTLAQKFAADLYVLTVTPDMSSFASFYAPHSNIQNFQDEVQKEAQKKLEALASRLEKAVKVETRIAKGDAADQIIEAIRSAGIDLVVIGTHSRKGLEKAIFGSVCDKVIKSALCPVLSIPPKG